MGILGFVSGRGGFGKISALGRVFGCGLILFLLLLSLSLRTGSSRILVEPRLIDAEFHKAWMPFFCRFGHPVVTPEQFLGLLVIHCLRSLIWIFLGKRVVTCRKWLVLKSLLLVRWMGGLGT